MPLTPYVSSSQKQHQQHQQHHRQQKQQQQHQHHQQQQQHFQSYTAGTGSTGKNHNYGYAPASSIGGGGGGYASSSLPASSSPSTGAYYVAQPPPSSSQASSQTSSSSPSFGYASSTANAVPMSQPSSLSSSSSTYSTSTYVPPPKKRFQSSNQYQEQRREALRGRQAKDTLNTMFGDEKPKILQTDIICIAGCEDKQTSADVSNVGAFQLPDPAGRAGGACTSSLLKILYQAEEELTTLSFVNVLERMRSDLKRKGFSQIPQLTSSQELDLKKPFNLCPEGFPGTRRALLIGINYVGEKKGELRGCHNDVENMRTYIQDFHGFQDEDIVVLMDDKKHPPPTKQNMIHAYKKIVADSKPGDCIFLHYSGHGSKVPDDNGDEDDGYDEVLCPVDFQRNGIIRDDLLNDIIVKGLPVGVHVVSLMDCCHSGTVLDLPFVFRADGTFKDGTMELDETFNWKNVGGRLIKGLLQGQSAKTLVKSVLNGQDPEKFCMNLIGSILKAKK